MPTNDILSADGLSFMECILKPRAEFMAFARRLTGGSGSASDDVVQCAYIKAMRGWPKFKVNPDEDPARAARGWMFIIVRGEFCRLYAKSRKENLHLPANSPPGATDPEHVRLHSGWNVETHCGHLSATHDSVCEQLLDSIADLPKHHREVIMLAYFFDMKVKEIAVAIGVNHKTVETRLTRARETLRTRGIAKYAREEYNLAALGRPGKAPLQAAEDLQADADGVDGVVTGDDDGALEFGEPAGDHAPAW